MHPRLRRTAPWLGLVLVALVLVALPQASHAAVIEEPVPPEEEILLPNCERYLSADVVALDQPYFWNRLGASQPHGQMYALRRDVEAISGSSPSAGNARLRRGKRPRPLVLRMNVGDCLTIRFTNWLDSSARDNQPVTREASIHVTGMQLAHINDDGSWVGENTSSLVSPNGTDYYTLFAEREGTYLMHSAGALNGGEGDNGTLSTGLFGAINVEPRGSTWYRSQVTQQELAWATTAQSTWPMPSLGAGFVHGFPTVNYNAVYPAGHPSAGLPILKMLHNDQVVHSDLTAIIAGGQQLANPSVYPNRQTAPFREFTIIFHDEIGALQAFPHFYDGKNDEKDDPDEIHRYDDTDPNGGLAYTLHSVRDAFAINYGTGGIGAEILANRLGVGPMHDCVNCLYEEFFLSAWAVGDPAMVVDVPANAPCTSESVIKSGNIETESGYCPPTPGPKASIAYYPDDPSNVYHSYLNDHVKFRNLLAGSDDHHIFHLHAHQWLHTPDSATSTYLDSQAIGQGTGFTYEIAYEGSGNRNKTPGDSIFHCHFYPHFAQGMWAMWRVHDVLEIGTPVNARGQVVQPSRALPDGEIANGTPIPGLVPMPGEPMPLPPSAPVSIVAGQVQIGPTLSGAHANPGYPFYIPAEAGQRPPAPPLDVYYDGLQHHDGGLPRHIINGGTFTEMHTRLDFSKHVTVANAYMLDENGEFYERQAMDYHADQIDGTVDGFITTLKPDGLSSGLFEVNGSPPIAGAPYADPCTRPVAGYPNARRFLTYKAANIQMDVVFNKKGWHFPQQRFLSLWEDVNDFLARTKPPEPLFIRANSYDCVEFLHTNLVPKEYDLDDYQVRTPTDILGQHIHLVKFDVTSSDGGANGFNYEDGTLSPEEVVGAIDAINKGGGIALCKNCKAVQKLTAKPHPFFGELGAQTTVQRWLVDPVLNNGYESGGDRTLRTVFTHDHFGPSTHQQVGLYAGLVTEKEGSLWYHNETGSPLGFDAGGNAYRHDGGPTSWQAVIEGPETFREFLFEFGDFQHAYGAETTDYPNPAGAVNPPGREKQWTQLASKPWIYEKPALVGHCPDNAPPPCPEAVSADDPGTMVVNYRNEPIALRVKDPSTNAQSPLFPAGDLSWAFASVPRHDPDLNQLEPHYTKSVTTKEDLSPYDPYTPLMRVYEDDRVKVRVLVGAHEEEHNFAMHGVRWLFEPSDTNSGYKSSQMMGISEFYDFEVPPLLTTDSGLRADIDSGRPIDFLYKAGASVDDLWNGIWGLIRVRRGNRPDLRVLSTNADARAPESELAAPSLIGPCPTSADKQPYHVYAFSAADVLSEGRIEYNDRPGLAGSPLNDPTGIVFVRSSDVQSSDKMLDKYGDVDCAYEVKDSAPREPLILRAAAGECVEVTLTNCVFNPRDEYGYSLVPNIIDEFNQNQVKPSKHVGLHAQELSYDVGNSDGNNVGGNPVQTVAPGNSKLYRWFAGITVTDSGLIRPKPVEFGAVTLYSSDPIKHSNKGAVGALIVEPPGATWTENTKSRAKAIVRHGSGLQFREFVLVTQDDINLQYGDGTPVRPLKVNEDPAETGQVAFNYRTEPVWFREGYAPEVLPNIQLANSFSNTQVPWDPEVGHDPKTPLFHAVAGEAVRFRLVHPGGDSQNHTWGLHGHIWQELPFSNNSTRIGNRTISEYKGAEYGHGPTNAFDVVPVHGAGGIFGVTGDFMYRDYVSWYLSNGLWGIFRVHGTERELLGDEAGWLQIAIEEPLDEASSTSAAVGEAPVE